MTEPNYAEFDELHRTRLIRPHLYLFEIISLARCIPPRRWGEAHQRYHCDCVNLKAYITNGLLKAQWNRSIEMKYDNTVVQLSDLLDFLDKAGPDVEWLRDFAKRWQSYAVPRGQGMQLREQTIGVRSRPSHRPPQQRDAALKVLRTFNSDQISQKTEPLVAEVNNRLRPEGMVVSKDTVQRALKKLLGTQITSAKG